MTHVWAREDYDFPIVPANFAFIVPVVMVIARGAERGTPRCVDSISARGTLRNAGTSGEHHSILLLDSEAANCHSTGVTAPNLGALVPQPMQSSTASSSPFG